MALFNVLFAVANVMSQTVTDTLITCSLALITHNRTLISSSSVVSRAHGTGRKNAIVQETYPLEPEIDLSFYDSLHCTCHI